MFKTTLFRTAVDPEIIRYRIIMVYEKKKIKKIPLHTSSANKKLNFSLKYDYFLNLEGIRNVSSERVSV